MPDREKVIRIIDELIFEAQKAPTWKAENALRCLKKEMLKEQDAVKPIRKLAYTKQGWFCGNCDNRLNRNGKYCSFCGKPILWEGRCSGNEP